jgi:hypothetical protein
MPYDMESQKNNTLKFLPNPGLTRMDRERAGLRASRETSRRGQPYRRGILRHIRRFSGTPHPNRLGTKEVERVLSHPAPEGQVSAPTRGRL